MKRIIKIGIVIAIVYYILQYTNVGFALGFTLG